MHPGESFAVNCRLTNAKYAASKTLAFFVEKK